MLFASANWKNWSTAPVEAPVWSAMLTWHLSHFSTIPPGLAKWQTFSVSVYWIVECSVTDLLNIKCRHAWSSQWCSWHLLSPSNQIPNANQLLLHHWVTKYTPSIGISAETNTTHHKNRATKINSPFGIVLEISPGIPCTKALLPYFLDDNFTCYVLESVHWKDDEPILRIKDTKKMTAYKNFTFPEL